MLINELLNLKEDQDDKLINLKKMILELEELGLQVGEIHKLDSLYLFEDYGFEIKVGRKDVEDYRHYRSVGIDDYRRLDSKILKFIVSVSDSYGLRIKKPETNNPGDKLIIYMSL
jgi:hypothetical protein